MLDQVDIVYRNFNIAHMFKAAMHRRYLLTSVSAARSVEAIVNPKTKRLLT
jgi:hypothetical protein